MQGQINIQLEDGSVFSGVVTLSQGPSAGVVKTKAPKTTELNNSGDLDFSLPLRPFMNDHADGLNGSKKYALLVAHFAHGESDVAVDRSEVVEAWNKMTGLLGGKFNGAHEQRAKDSGYVYVPTAGKVALLKKWRTILS